MKRNRVRLRWCSYRFDAYFFLNQQDSLQFRIDTLKWPWYMYMKTSSSRKWNTQALLEIFTKNVQHHGSSKSCSWYKQTNQKTIVTILIDGSACHDLLFYRWIRQTQLNKDTPPFLRPDPQWPNQSPHCISCLSIQSSRDIKASFFHHQRKLIPTQTEPKCFVSVLSDLWMRSLSRHRPALPAPRTTLVPPIPTRRSNECGKTTVAHGGNPIKRDW